MATNPFTAHPHAAGETYLEHFGVAIGVGRQLIGAAGAAVVHALIPALYPTTAGDRIRELADCIERHDRDGLRGRQRRGAGPAEPAPIDQVA